MIPIQIRDADMSDAEALANALYRPDAEFIAKLGIAPLDAVGRSLSDSKASWAIDRDGEALGLVGVVESPLKGCGNMWMLGTDALFTTHRRWLVRNSRHFVRRLLDQWKTIDALVDQQNKPLNRWVGWLGFTLLGTTTDGVGRSLNRWRLS